MRLGRITASLIATLALLLAGVVMAPAAVATHPGCGGARNEAELLAQNSWNCRITFIIDPGQGKFVTRDQLVADAAMYWELGYDRNFLYWSGERVISGAGHRWAHCETNWDNRSCANDDFRHEGPVSDTFAGHAEPPLTVYGDHAGFIARVCGNSKTVPARIIDRYHPSLNGAKFHDRNRDGVRQAGEEPLAGWTFRIEQTRADYGPALGVVGHATTGPDGRWTYDLVGASPGDYRVVEEGRPDWKVTTPETFSISVPAGAENHAFEVGSWGNAPTTADVAKAEFALVDPPSDIKADTPTEVTVRVGLVNHGPADDVAVIDTVRPSSPNLDCSFSPEVAVLRPRLTIGTPHVEDVTFTVTCTEPSNHSWVFDDELVLAMPGFRDPAPANNTRSVTHHLEVWDNSDLSVSDAALNCPPRTDIGQPVICTATATVTNGGPHGPTETATEMSIQVRDDCMADVLAGTEPDNVTLAVGDSVDVAQSWTVVCAQRSFHPKTATITALPVTPHVEDLDSSDDTASAEDVLEVFEPADLAVAITDLRCSEREANPTGSACVATVDVTNNGPADAVAAALTTALDPAADCVATPSAAEVEQLTLAAGERRTLERGYQLSCTDAVRHDVLMTAAIGNDETDPHAEDRNLTNNTDELLWLPSDAKPRSLPSSVNVSKAGALPLALLSTARVDTVAEVDVPTVRYGVTGGEDSVERCATGGEDVNDDGRPDLVCQADTALTGISCTTTEMVATGRLRSGTRFISQDDVKVTGCRN